MSAIAWWYEHSSALPFLGTGMRIHRFQSCGHCWVFQICWRIECSTFTASSFRIWNSSAGIPSRPLALFVVMLPKAHLISHSRMSGSEWETTPPWLSGSLRSFLYSSSVYYFHLFLISSASVRSSPFLSFIVPNFGWNFPLIFPVFSKRSLVLAYLLLSSLLCTVHWGRPSCLSSLFSGSAFSWGTFPFLSRFLLFFSQLFVKPPQITLCLLASLWDGFIHCLLYSITDLAPWFLRCSVY